MNHNNECQYHTMLCIIVHAAYTTWMQHEQASSQVRNTPLIVAITNSGHDMIEIQLRWQDRIKRVHLSEKHTFQHIQLLPQNHVVSLTVCWISQLWHSAGNINSLIITAFTKPLTWSHNITIPYIMIFLTFLKSYYLTVSNILYVGSQQRFTSKAVPFC